MKRPEQEIQQAIVKYFEYQYPSLKGCLCANLNNSKDARTGGINKSMGVVAGRSDLVLYWESQAFFIEVKVPKGKQSQVQKEWQNKMKESGFNYFIVYSIDDFIELIEYIFKNLALKF
jgi:hypothetical protein